MVKTLIKKIRRHFGLKKFKKLCPHMRCSVCYYYFDNGSHCELKDGLGLN